jgi:hypothetical protein
MKIGCPFCGIEFERDTRSRLCVRYRYCSVECKHADGRKKSAAYVESGRPLVAVFADHIKCLIPGCGASLRSASTHFARTHGLDLYKKMPLWERQQRYGVTQGTRLACHELIDIYRQRAIDTDFAARGAEFDCEKMHQSARLIREEVGESRRSEPQMDALGHIIGTDLHGSQVRKSRARRAGKCVNCAKEFTYRAGDKRKSKYVFCSKECSSKWVGQNQNIFISPEARKRARETLRLTLRGKLGGRPKKD